MTRSTELLTGLLVGLLAVFGPGCSTGGESGTGGASGRGGETGAGGSGVAGEGGTAGITDGGQMDSGGEGGKSGEGEFGGSGGSGGAVDAEVDADGAVDAKVDADRPVDATVDAGSDFGAACVEGGNWYDPATGLCWQDPPPDSGMTMIDADLYCYDLKLRGFDDWRLPKIQELISFIRGCDQSACGVTDPDCLDSYCSDSCAVCLPLSGPGKDGCYRDPAVSGSCGWTWSSSSYAPNAANAWCVNFNLGNVNFDVLSVTSYVRCVRGGP